MPNMMDYLVWRGDVTPDRDPWNAVDCLILATLSYLDYPAPGGMVAELAPTLGSPPEREIGFVHDARALLSACGMTERFAAVRLHRASSVLDREKEAQFAAVTASLTDGSHVLVYRGTDNTITGWREDFNMAFESPIPAQTLAVEYLLQAAAELEGPLLLAGHSKGGNLAVYAAAHAPADVQQRIRWIYSFDGPGLDDATLVSAGYAAVARRICSYVPQSSVVGLLLTYHPEYTVVRSDAVSVLQHDCFSWQVLGRDFIRVTEVDVASQLVDQTVHAWLAQITPEQRRRFVDTFFDLLEATGATTMKDLVRNVPANAAAILRALPRVDLDTAKMIVSLLHRLVSIGAQNVAELVRQRGAGEAAHDSAKGEFLP